jgi:hypothetical protein
MIPDSKVVLFNGKVIAGNIGVARLFEAFMQVAKGNDAMTNASILVGM